MQQTFQRISAAGLQRTFTGRITSKNLCGPKLLTRRSRATNSRQFTSSAPRAVLETAVTVDDPSTAPPSEASNTPPTLLPGEIDKQRFKRLHWSVSLWEDFAPQSWMSTLSNDDLPATERLREFANTLTNLVSRTGALNDAKAAQYWAYHLLRSGFFMAQGVLGLTTARQALGGDSEQSGIYSRIGSMLQNGWQGPLAEAMLMFYQDYENIKEGRYAMPYDMELTNAEGRLNRQFNPLFILNRTSRFLREATDTLRRRERATPDELWLKSAFLPDYYKTFHYQSDGWMTQASAKVYEVSTETLFVGRQDAMQRSTMVALSDFMADKNVDDLKALEVACGTGRFATFVKDNYPTLDLTVSDMSPFYLAEARENFKYWKRTRAPNLTLPGVDGNGVTFLQTPAEDINAPDNSYDIVYCVYLFHELPEDVRRQAVFEMARVLKPGGILVLTDSMQLGDRSCYKETMGNFQGFNEPYYRNYLSTDLGAIFEEAGLECDMKVLASTSKSLSFKKPMAPSSNIGASSTNGAANVVASVEEMEVDGPVWVGETATGLSTNNSQVTGEDDDDNGTSAVGKGPVGDPNLN